MKYSRLINKRKQYKYSVNICFDLRDEERLSGFIPNVTTTDIIREYLGGIIRGNSEVHSRILYGSYGTGKSHLLTVLSAILGHINTKGEGFKNFTQLISKYDNELASDIKKYAKEKKPYLVVPVYSDYSDFSKCITLSIKKELDRNKIAVCFKGFFDEALALVEKWEGGQESEQRLKQECKKQKIKLADLKRGLASYDSSFEKIFNSIYSGMSYGAAFNSTTGNLIDNMNIANDAIQSKYRGIVLIFDEFGRYVEDYGEELKVKTIQDLAEYCDHSNYDNYLILVSHKQLSMYTNSMKKNISDEWKKVEGRFKATSINVKYDQCLSLIGHIIPKTNHWDSFKKTYEKELNELYNQAWDFKGFLLPPDSSGENPFENGFPLHPITLFALDRLSKKVAQNERTFFTYLAGDEENTLFAQLDTLDTKSFHFIGLDDIYDYFELNIKTYKTDESYATYKKLHYALNKLGSNQSDLYIKVLKAIAAIKIIGDYESLSADRETLLNVIDGDRKELSNAIDDLEKKKIVKFMRQYGYYDFFDSSIFDLEGMIDDRLNGISDEMVVSILNDKFSDFVLYPYEYNEKYYMNRVFVPVFSKKGDLTKKSFHNSLPKYYDGSVIFVLDDQADEEEYVSLSGLPNRSVLLVNGNSKSIDNEVKRYIAIQYYYSKKDELANDDPTVVNELKLYLDEQESIVTDLLEKWRTLGDPGTFVIENNTCFDITSEQELSHLLSTIMERSFSKTLKVNNDLLNKNNLTGAIKQARIKALESIMEHENIYEGCPFLSPEFNILRSSLSKNGIVDNKFIDCDLRIATKDLNTHDDGTPTGKPVIQEIKKYLKRAEKERLPLFELYEKLKQEPFGLRDGYIPVLLAYSLKDYQNVSLYFHGNEHPYTEDELVKALSEPENYTLFICNWNESEIEYIESLEKTFSAYLPKGDSLNRLGDLFKAINAHYASISKSARTTEIYVSDLAKQYRNILNLSYKDYNGFFFETLPSINKNLSELALQIQTIKRELESVEAQQYSKILRITRQVFGIKEGKDFIASLKSLYKNELKEKSHKAFDYTTNNILDLIANCDNITESDFLYQIAKATTGFELGYWSDSKINDYEEIIQQSFNKLNSYQAEASLSKGETKITIESADAGAIVSQFSQTALSPTGQTMLNKIEKTLSSFGDSVSYEEKISIITQILKDAIN